MKMHKQDEPNRNIQTGWGQSKMKKEGQAKVHRGRGDRQTDRGAFRDGAHIKIINKTWDFSVKHHFKTEKT